MLLSFLRLVLAFVLLFFAQQTLVLKSITFTDLMLNSFRYGFGALCFLFGFLAVASIIRNQLENFISMGIKERYGAILLEFSLLTGIYWVLFERNVWLSSASLIMAVIYGVLSANIETARAAKKFRKGVEG
ncbi:hypothetical protein [Guptibacillus algicola]|uniref:hypothetical protein n=1 Tax=Guptibacillus algicola TaxID=225844 RepID=UPI001CD48DD0|nr:hypothetical protein [Alkalihalobacillus algicola]MCA0985819.1 hypothetical protein [Alkalihalobacillus algicola]